MPYPQTAMMKRTTLAAICVAFPLLIHCRFDALAMQPDPSSAATCRIHVSEEADGLRLEAIAFARRTIAGHYKLSVAKESASGSSQNLESGDFNTDGTHEQILATVTLDRSAIGHYRATLSLEWDEGRVSCNSP
jgi:hypothetical protein